MVPRFQFLVQSSKFQVLSTHFTVPSLQFSVPISQYTVHSFLFPDPWPLYADPCPLIPDQILNPKILPKYLKVIKETLQTLQFCFFWYILYFLRSVFLGSFFSNQKVFSFVSPFCTKIYACSSQDYFLLITLILKSLNLNITVTTLLQGGLYSMRCLDVQSRVAGCFTIPLFKACQLDQQ